MAFTEFTCRSGGNNMNAGSLDGSAEASVSPLVTYTGGSLVQSTGVFTVASGNPVSAGVVVGQIARVMVDGETTPTNGRIARVAAVTSTTITISTATNGVGTMPTDGTGNRTVIVGGAWAGPSGSNGFPLTFGGFNLTGRGGARINLKNDQTYNITAAISVSNNVQNLSGYASTFGDGGFATIDGGTSGASYVLLTTDQCNVSYLKLQNNGASGSAAGFTVGVSGTSNNYLFKVVVSNVRGDGFVGVQGGGICYECEVYGANQGGGTGGFVSTQITTAYRCISRGNAVGFSSVSSCVDCIASGNTSHGFDGVQQSINCDAYANGNNGFQVTGPGSGKTRRIIENCNSVNNAGWGINYTGSQENIWGRQYNCGFAGNGSGTFSLSAASAVVEGGSFSYPVGTTPWVDPANGDFRLASKLAIATGRGQFTQTQPGQSGTRSYPSIGACEPARRSLLATMSKFRGIR